MDNLSKLLTIPIPFEPSYTSGSLTLSTQLLPCLPEEPTWSDPALLDWPTAIANTEFVCELIVKDSSNRTVVLTIPEGQGLVRRPTEVDQQSDRWKAIFRPDILMFDARESVRSSRLDGITTFSAVDLSDAQLNYYASAMAIAETRPEDRWIVWRVFQELAGSNSRHQAAESDFEAYLESISNPAPSDRCDIPNKASFSAAIHGIASYYELASRFSLSLEFSVDLPQDLPGEGFVRLVPSGERNVETQFTPAHYSAFQVAFELLENQRTVDGSGTMVRAWMPRSRTQNRWGYIDFDDFFDLQRHDVDGTELKRKNAALSSFLSADRPSESVTSDKANALHLPPSVRSQGFMILERNAADNKVRNDRGIEQRWEDCSRTAPSTPLYMDDLISGFRFDVQTNGTRFSLHKHGLDFSSVSGGLLYSGDSCENFVERCTSETQESGASTVTENIHEAIAVWDGWSMAVPRPTKLQEAPGTGKEAFIQTQTLLKSSLPRLRYRRMYRFAARAVFLNGLGLDLDSLEDAAIAPDDFLGNEIVYKRMEPVASPYVITEDEIDRKDANAQMVIGHERGFQRVRRRWFYPPATEWSICEMDGAIDRFSSDSSEQHAMLSSRVKSSTKSAKNRAVKAGEPVNYLPDPWCVNARVQVRLTNRRAETTVRDTVSRRRIVLLDAPNQTWEPADPLPYYARGDSWPEASPFVVEFIATSGGESYIEPPRRWRAGATIRIYQAPGDEIQVLLQADTQGRSSNHVLDDWRIAGQAAIRSALAQPANQSIERVQDAARLIDSAFDRVNSRMERLPLLVPPTLVTCIHGVTEPVLPVEATAPVCHRDIGGEMAHVTDSVTVDGATTADIALVGIWTDFVDDVNQPAPAATPVREIVSNPVAINPDASSRHIPGEACQITLPDTAARLIECHWRSRGRFDIEKVGAPGVKRGRSFVLECPNSQMPPGPDVRHLAPLFLWDRERSRRGALRSRRRGYAFRVYLNRPWGRTGPNEHLGVVCWPDEVVDLTDKMRDSLYPYVAQWGKEPLLQTSELPDGPWTQDFYDITTDANQRASVFSNVSLPEFAADDELQALKLRRVFVAGFQPEYDESKQLWYADIEIRSRQSYLPWLKLSFVRYQPSSVDGCHCSFVSEPYLTQLQPNRITTATVNPVDRQLVQLVVAGPSGKGHEDRLSTPNLTVQLQKHQYGDVWADEGQPIAMDRIGDTDVTGHWRTMVRLPRSARDGYRLELREEVWASVDTKPLADGARRRSRDSRTIYLEHIPLDVLLNRTRDGQNIRGAA